MIKDRRKDVSYRRDEVIRNEENKPEWREKRAWRITPKMIGDIVEKALALLIKAALKPVSPKGRPSASRIKRVFAGISGVDLTCCCNPNIYPDKSKVAYEGVCCGKNDEY